jgi:pyruvate dehydrogenase E2 component (dihydrolipoamide acetyltransferase)
MSFEIYKPKYKSLFRKIAIGSWWNSGDPSVYGLADVDMTEALKFIEKTKKEKNVTLTATHLVGQAVVECLKLRPEVNSIMIRHQIYYRKNIDIFFQVNIEGDDHSDKTQKAELSGVTLRGLQHKSIFQLAEELKSKATKLKKFKEGELMQVRSTMEFIPNFIMKHILLGTSFLNFDLGLPLHWFGVPKDPFGAIMITSVGSMGIDWALAPLVPYSRSPMLLAVGAIQKHPRVVETQGQPDSIEIRHMMKIGVTFDHRFIDGAHAADMLKTFKECFASPEKYFNKN